MDGVLVLFVLVTERQASFCRGGCKGNGRVLKLGVLPRVVG